MTVSNPDVYFSENPPAKFYSLFTIIKSIFYFSIEGTEAYYSEPEFQFSVLWRRRRGSKNDCDRSHVQAHAIMHHVLTQWILDNAKVS